MNHQQVLRKTCKITPKQLEDMDQFISIQNVPGVLDYICSTITREHGIYITSTRVMDRLFSEYGPPEFYNLDSSRRKVYCWLITYGDVRYAVWSAGKGRGTSYEYDSNTIPDTEIYDKIVEFLKHISNGQK